MLKIKPRLTEKALAQSKVGRYTFDVPLFLSLGQAKRELEELFEVKIKDLWSVGRGPERRVNRKRQAQIRHRQKMVVVTLKSGRLDFFESSKAASAKEETSKNRQVVKKEKTEK